MQDSQFRTIRLGVGCHEEPEPDAKIVIGCVNEIAAMLAGEDWGDDPHCVDSSARAIGLLYNDSYSTAPGAIELSGEAKAECDTALQADEYAQQLPWRLSGSYSPEHEQARSFILAEFILSVVFDTIAHINSTEDLGKAIGALDATQPDCKDFAAYCVLTDIRSGFPQIAGEELVTTYDLDPADRPLARHYLDKILALTEKKETVQQAARTCCAV